MIDSKEKEEAIRLRVEEQLSLNEIRDITGISKGSLSVLLRSHPLSAEVVKEKLSRGFKKLNAERGKYGPEKSKFALMVKSELSTDQRGQIAEAAVLFRLSLIGYEVWKAEFGNSRVDWLIHKPDSYFFIRLQVKWARRGKDGRPYFSLKHDGTRSVSATSKHCDFIIGYDLETDTAYVVPTKICDELSTSKSCDLEYAESWNLLDE